MQVTIGVTVVTLLEDTLEIEDRFDERSVCSFTVHDNTNHYQRGQAVEVQDDASNVIFAGFIETPVEQVVTPSGDTLHTIDCCDNHYLADKRIAAKAYTSQTCGAIVSDLITTYLAAEGVTAGTIQAGITLNAAVFNYVPISRAMDELAERAGYWWRINHDKSLDFCAPTAVDAPWDIAASGGIYADMLEGTVSVERANPLYRNRQYVRGGRDITDPQTEIQYGDGAKQAFTLAYQLAKVPTVEISSGGSTSWSSQTEGIKQVETARQWFWRKGDPVIAQASTDTPLGATDRIRVTYQGQYDFVARSHDQSAIDDRLAVEGSGTGIVEDVVDDRTIESREEAFQLAAQKLARYAQVNRVLKYTTRRTGLEPGQVQTVTIAEHGLSAVEMLIESVHTRRVGGELEFGITALGSYPIGSWARFFSRLADRGESFVDRENIYADQILVTSDTFPESWVWAESVIATVHACSVPAADLYPADAGLYPC
jgi:hypothetical protein